MASQDGAIADNGISSGCCNKALLLLYMAPWLLSMLSLSIADNGMSSPENSASGCCK